MTYTIRRRVALTAALLASLFLLMLESNCDDGSGPWRQVTITAAR